MPTIQLYSVGQGFGYLVECQEAGARIRQDFAPGLPGFVSMTEAEAQAYAEAEVAALQAAQAAQAGQGGGDAPAVEP